MRAQEGLSHAAAMRPSAPKRSRIWKIPRRCFQPGGVGDACVERAINLAAATCGERTCVEPVSLIEPDLVFFIVSPRTSKSPACQAWASVEVLFGGGEAIQKSLASLRHSAARCRILQSSIFRVCPSRRHGYKQ